MATRAPIRTIGIKVQGYGAIKRRSSRLRALPRNLVNLQRSTGDKIVVSARHNAPVLTGLLYSTIQRRNTPAGAIVSVGEPNPNPPPASEIPRRRKFVDIPSMKPARYALLQHESLSQPRRHYLSMAYHEHVDPLRKKYLRKELRKAVKE